MVCSAMVWVAIFLNYYCLGSFCCQNKTLHLHNPKKEAAHLGGIHLRGRVSWIRAIAYIIPMD